MRVIYSVNAEKDLSRLDRSVAIKIIKKVKELTDEENPLSHAKPLTAKLSGLYRFRIGDYRAIFSVDKDGTFTMIIILHIAHRKDIYR